MTLLMRALRLRCPVCGRGKLFHHVFTMYERCPVCDYRYEREEGYFSSAMAINIVISEFIVAGFTVPLAANPSIPAWMVLLGGAPFTVLLPLLLYRHSRSTWLSMDIYVHPLQHSSD
ncbi:MAG: DUF983 domain-containing protein [Ktedonobacteraceae bacterium]|nr:DUF983 domain-containing protein [Ktedonobacteraceae bacterium]MBO0792322.1 DUF983 domain-containing protein [Ktedonobacteraceae bacterium]